MVTFFFFSEECEGVDHSSPPTQGEFLQQLSLFACAMLQHVPKDSEV